MPKEKLNLQANEKTSKCSMIKKALNSAVLFPTETCFVSHAGNPKVALT